MVAIFDLYYSNEHDFRMKIPDLAKNTKEAPLLFGETKKRITSGNTKIMTTKDD